MGANPSPPKHYVAEIYMYYPAGYVMSITFTDFSHFLFYLGGTPGTSLAGYRVKDQTYYILEG